MNNDDIYYRQFFAEATIEEKGALIMILQELRHAEVKHPKFGQDIVHRAAIVCEEAGELAKAAIDHHYTEAPFGDVLIEAVQTGATAMRMILSLGRNEA